MKDLISITVAALGALIAGPALAQTTACPQTGQEGPLELHRAWIMEGWERRAGDPPFDFAEKLGRFYDLTDPDGVFYDNYAPGETQLFTDASRYGANWKSLQDAARTVSHGLHDEAADALVSDTVASTTLGFVGRLEQLTGEVTAFDARSQLAWRCVNGSWKIHHELNYAWSVDPTSIEPLLSDPGAE